MYNKKTDSEGRHSVRRLSPYYFRLILCLSFKFKTKYSVYYEKDLTFW